MYYRREFAASTFVHYAASIFPATSLIDGYAHPPGRRLAVSLAREPSNLGSGSIGGPTSSWQRR
eukprot:4516340-Pyramimonas_sp.AAC.1